VIGQIHPDETCTGLGREVDYGIYEGQFAEDDWNGFGRRIISNGDFYLGYWKEGMKDGQGIYVYQNYSNVANDQIQIEDGLWVEDEFKGETRNVTKEELKSVITLNKREI